LGGLQFLTFRTNATMNICVPVFAWTSIAISLDVVHLGVELLGYIVIVLNLLKNCQICFKATSSFYISQQQCLRGSIFPHP
jgi:hypothetical protein